MNSVRLISLESDSYSFHKDSSKSKLVNYTILRLISQFLLVEQKKQTSVDRCNQFKHQKSLIVEKNDVKTSYLRRIFSILLYITSIVLYGWYRYPVPKTKNQDRTQKY